MRAKCVAHHSLPCFIRFPISISLYSWYNSTDSKDHLQRRLLKELSISSAPIILDVTSSVYMILLIVMVLKIYLGFQ